jgi:flagellin
MVQTASSALSSLTSSLQRIRQLAVQASTGSLSSSDQAALQKEVAAQISEVNRIASQTTYNGTNILDGSAGSLTFQVGANVGQTISLNLSQSMSAAKIGGGLVQTGQTVGTVSLSVDTAGVYTTAASPAITAINVLSDGKGGYTFTDQNNQAIAATVAQAVFGAGATAGTGTQGTALALAAAATTTAGAGSAAQVSAVAQINAINSPPTVSNLDISTVTGANEAMVSIDNALQTVNNLQASLGAAQNRFTAISTSQQAESTDLSSAQSQITDANFAQETANLSKAQVLQQAGISVLAQANSNPQQVLKLLQ